MNEERYNEIIDSLLVGTDMDDEVSRRMAYNACLAYAEANFRGDPEVNRFVALAATRLRQARVHFGVIKGMVPLPDEGRLHLRYTEQGGPVLTGNADGLRYLSELCAALADTLLPQEDGPEEHVHLYPGELPMFGTSYGLTVYHSSDIWFDRHGAFQEHADEDMSGAAAASTPPREITPERIAAIEFFEEDGIPLPPPLYLRYDKLYRVLDFRLYLPDSEVWAKPFGGEGAARMIVFTIRDDAQELFEIALHLDDPSLHYFTKNDLEQVWGADQ